MCEELKVKLAISFIDICTGREEHTEHRAANRFSWMEEKSPITLCPAVLTSLLAIQLQR